MVGSAVFRLLREKGFDNLIGKNVDELDLRNYNLVNSFFEKEKPEYVINSAAVVGGILANDTYPYKFLIENLQIQNNLISCAHSYNVNKFIFR